MSRPGGPAVPDDQPTSAMRNPVPTSPDNQPTGAMRTPPPSPDDQPTSAMRTPPPAPPGAVPPGLSPRRRAARAIIGVAGGVAALVVALVAILLVYSSGRASADRAAATRTAGQQAQTRAANVPLLTQAAARAVAPTQTRAAELAQLADLQTQVAARAATPTAAPVVAIAPPAPAPATATQRANDLSKATLVGRIVGSDAFVGLVVNGADVTAYVCDGPAWRAGSPARARVTRSR